MIGSRVGSKVARYGSAVGSVSDDEGGGAAPDPMAGVTQDAASSKYFPATASEWATTLTAAGLSSNNGPVHLYTAQEASGNLADAIGAVSLASAGTPTYQQAISGYTRKGIVFDVNSTDAFTSAAGPDLSTVSTLALTVVRFSGAAPAGFRQALSLGGAGSRTTFGFNATPAFEARNGAAAGTGTVNPIDSAVHCVVMRHNRTGAEFDAMWESEKISPVYASTVAGQGILVDNTGSGSADFALLYLAIFSGADAELSDAQIKTLMETLGWTVAW